MSVLNLTENVQSDPVALSMADIDYLSGERFRHNFTVRLTTAGTLIYPKNVIGSFPLSSGVTINVRPKLPMPNIFRMLSYVEDLNWSIDGIVGLDQDLGLFDILASMFVDEFTLILRHGLRLGYSSKEEFTQSLRGRVLLVKTFARGLNRPDELVCRFDRLSSDCPENRAVATALEVLTRCGSHRVDTRRRLKSCLHKLPTEISNARFSIGDFSKIAMGRHNHHYKRILSLSRLILRFTSFSNSHGTIQNPAFMINVGKLFERFVGKALVEGAPNIGLSVHLQKARPLDTGNQVNCKPDIVITDLAGQQVLAVADTKYKDFQRKGLSEADAYQMLAYMTAFDTQDSVLLYPAATHTDCSCEMISLASGGSRLNITRAGVDLNLPVNEIAAAIFAKLRHDANLGTRERLVV